MAQRSGKYHTWVVGKFLVLLTTLGKSGVVKTVSQQTIPPFICIYTHKLPSYSQALLLMCFHEGFVYISPNMLVAIDKFLSFVSF